MTKNLKILSKIGILIVLCLSIGYLSKNKNETLIKENKKNQEGVSKYIAFLQENDSGNYDNVDVMPTVGYKLNKEKSTCSNGATPILESNNNVKIVGLTKDNTNCYLYFDKLEAELKILASNPSRGIMTAVNGVATEEDTGVYEAPDDYGTSYYFRGLSDNLNNWVKFAGFYWRIIRVNGNGSVRMIYSGVANGLPADANKKGAATIINEEKYFFNGTGNDNAYVGYMMGIDNVGDGSSKSETTNHSTNYENAHANIYDSYVKKQVDKWYKANIEDKGHSNLIDTEAGFCNNRKLGGVAYLNYQGEGYGTENSGYATLDISVKYNTQLKTEKPFLKCSNKNNDLFTYTSANEGNKKLKYPVGMITYDEAVFAGNFMNSSNASLYLNSNVSYWTMTPGMYNSYANVYIYGTGGGGGYTHVFATNVGIRPVINLRADTVLTGTGSESDPFIVI